MELSSFLAPRKAVMVINVSDMLDRFFDRLGQAGSVRTYVESWRDVYLLHS